MSPEPEPTPDPDPDPDPPSVDTGSVEITKTASSESNFTVMLRAGDQVTSTLVKSSQFQVGGVTWSNVEYGDYYIFVTGANSAQMNMHGFTINGSNVTTSWITDGTNYYARAPITIDRATTTVVVKWYND